MIIRRHKIPVPSPPQFEIIPELLMHAILLCITLHITAVTQIYCTVKQPFLGCYVSLQSFWFRLSGLGSRGKELLFHIDIVKVTNPEKE